MGFQTLVAQLTAIIAFVVKMLPTKLIVLPVVPSFMMSVNEKKRFVRFIRLISPKYNCSIGKDAYEFLFNF